MNAAVKITSLGITALEHPLRGIKDGKEYDYLFPQVDWKETIVRKNGTVWQTVEQMKKVICDFIGDVQHIAPLLKGGSHAETCRNIWNFLFDHIKYKEDERGKEQLRRPARSWAERKRGIDCDDFTIFSSSLLIKNGISHLIRVARYPQADHFQHVYPVALPGERLIIIDAVLDSFDKEHQPIAEKRDFLIKTKNAMEKTALSGIDIAVLSGIEDEAELFGVLQGSDFEEIFRLEGLGKTSSREEDLQALYHHLVRTRNLISQNPGLVKQVEHPENFLQMLDYAIRYWNTDRRDEALDILMKNEDRINALEGLGEIADEYERVEVLYGINELGGVTALGRTKGRRAFFKKISEAVKKAGQGIKKAVQAVVRYNPVSLAARGGVLLAMKINLGRQAERLKWGYLTEQEAQEAGFDMNEWAKSKDALARTEKMFTQVLKGDAENLKRAILEGRAGGLSGIGLGVEPVSTAGTTAAAAGFLAKIGTWVKGISLKKMLSKVNPLKLLKKKKAEVTQPEDTTPKDETPKEQNSSFPDESKTPGTTSKTTDQSPPPPPPPGEESMLTKVTAWVKEHPGTSLLIGGGLVLALFPGARRAVGLSKAKGKKAPALSGPKKKRKPKKRQMKIVKL